MILINDQFEYIKSNIKRNSWLQEFPKASACYKGIWNSISANCQLRINRNFCPLVKGWPFCGKKLDLVGILKPIPALILKATSEKCHQHSQSSKELKQLFPKWLCPKLKIWCLIFKHPYCAAYIVGDFSTRDYLCLTKPKFYAKM